MHEPAQNGAKSNRREPARQFTRARREIRATLSAKPEIFITHPAELRILRDISDDQLRQFAADNGWCIVRRISRRQIEFYNDASVSAP